MQLEWINILYFKLVCINSLDGFQSLATNGFKQRIFSSNLSLVYLELFSDGYKKEAVSIFLVTSKILSKNTYSKAFVEHGYHTIRQWYDIQ